MASWRALHEPGEIAWLCPETSRATSTGFEVAGWPSETWVLHAMYETTAKPSWVTYDQQRRDELGLPPIEPVSLPGGGSAYPAQLTGAPGNYVERPGAEWTRLRWADYFKRFDGRRADWAARPPGYQWFAHASWPISIFPPPEGSLDQASLEALLRVLATRSADGAATECVAYYGHVPNTMGRQGASLDHRVGNGYAIFAGRLADIADLLHQPYDYITTPSNFWPRDHSWLVWTDWDMQGTKVGGSQALLDDLRRDNDLETIDLTWHGAM